MIGEISIGGVYIPSLLLLGFIALGMTTSLVTLFAILGVYRFITARPLIDLALFIFCLWVAVGLSGNWNLRP
jgi:hypothetical protein